MHRDEIGGHHQIRLYPETQTDSVGKLIMAGISSE